jgi:hypothetical protein
MAVVYFDQGPIAQALMEELSDRESEAEALFFTEPPKKPEELHPREEVKEKRKETMSVWRVMKAYLCLSPRDESKERVRTLLISHIKDDEDLSFQRYILVLKQALAALVTVITIALLINLTAGVLVASILG